VFDLMWRYSYNLRGIYETPSIADEIESTNGGRQQAQLLIENARRTGRTVLTEFESKQLLRFYGIPTVETRIASTEDEAASAAREIGFPVVVKLHSETVTHKTDVGGVKLNVIDEIGVRDAYRAIRGSVAERAGSGHFLGVTVQKMMVRDGYELILGSTVDSQFGPVIVFGSGGELVEVYRDRALGLPPLNTTLAHRMMEQTRIFKALGGVRGRKPVDFRELESIAVRFSRLILENPAIKESDINPLIASSEQFLALDARFVLQDMDVPENRFPKPAIRPYPIQYVSSWKTADGSNFTIRPIRPEDEPLMVRFHETLSQRSVFLRYFQSSKLNERVDHERLTRMCFLDYDRDIALLADKVGNSALQLHEILGVARLCKLRDSNRGELAVVVSDVYQHCGLGLELVSRLIDVAQQEGLDSIHAYVLQENIEMQGLLRKLQFTISTSDDPSILFASLPLTKPLVS